MQASFTLCYAEQDLAVASRRTFNRVMNPCPPFGSPSHPLPQSLPEPGPSGFFDTDIPDDWPCGDSVVDPNVLSNFYLCSSEPTTVDPSQWAEVQAEALAASEEQPHTLLSSGIPFKSIEKDFFAENAPSVNLANVSQWLDGAYRPPTPCTHCRRHRLQCLIIRTTSANPNPITSCSSCVALFRECSLSKGEKRLPSRFETFSPVLGHLHGLPEDTEDPVCTRHYASCEILIQGRVLALRFQFRNREIKKSPNNS